MQENKLRVIALTSKATSSTDRVWKDVSAGMYSVVLASPEMLFEPDSLFWRSILRGNSTAFSRRLACIAVDEAHLIWGWREFRKNP